MASLQQLRHDVLAQEQAADSYFSVALKFRKTVAKTVAIKPTIDTLCCPRCKADKSQIKNDGIRKNKAGSIQRFACKSCGKRFSYNIGFERMRATPQMITTPMQLYFSSESLRSVQLTLKKSLVRLINLVAISSRGPSS